MPESQFIHLPPGVIFAHYAADGAGSCSVVSSRGATLGASFYDLRESFEFVCSIHGAGSWVALLPRPKPIQPTLFSREEST